MSFPSERQTNLVLIHFPFQKERVGFCLHFVYKRENWNIHVPSLSRGVGEAGTQKFLTSYKGEKPPVSVTLGNIKVCHLDYYYRINQGPLVHPTKTRMVKYPSILPFYIMFLRVRTQVIRSQRSRCFTLTNLEFIESIKDRSLSYK